MAQGHPLTLLLAAVMGSVWWPCQLQALKWALCPCALACPRPAAPCPVSQAHPPTTLCPHVTLTALLAICPHTSYGDQPVPPKQTQPAFINNAVAPTDGTPIQSVGPGAHCGLSYTGGTPLYSLLGSLWFYSLVSRYWLIRDDYVAPMINADFICSDHCHTRWWHWSHT